MTAARALDRVVMWNFHFLPILPQENARLADWDKFGFIPAPVQDWLNIGADWGAKESR